jgi:hypothetical protein
MLAVGAAALALPETAEAAYQRPYGPNAAWNRPVSDFGVNSKSAQLSAKMNVSNVNLTFKNWTYPVFEAPKATTILTVRLRHTDWGNMHNQKIPWNPAWVPSHGYWSTANPGWDSQVIVLDPATGREWNLWQVSKPDLTNKILKAGSGSLVPGSYWTKEDGFAPPRGCGIQTLAMLLRPQEVAEGQIRHGLSMPFRGIDDNLFVKPAMKTDGATAQYAVADGVPMGTRFALKATEADLTAWANTLPAGMRQAALVIARCLIEYGWFITDNSGSNHIQCEDRNSAGSQWDALGFKQLSANGKSYPQDLLDGLLKPERVYAIAAP